MIIIKPAIILNGKEFFNKIFPKKVADAQNIIKTTEKPKVNKIRGSKLIFLLLIRFSKVEPDIYEI